MTYQTSIPARKLMNPKKLAAHMEQIKALSDLRWAEADAAKEEGRDEDPAVRWETRETLKQIRDLFANDISFSVVTGQEPYPWSIYRFRHADGLFLWWAQADYDHAAGQLAKRVAS